MARICNKYKLGDIVIYSGDYYRVTSVRRTTTSIPYTIWDYEYNLFLDRDPREGELSLIKGVNERAISCKVDDERKERPEYFPDYKFDPKFIERRSVDSSLKALDELNKREFERVAASPIRIDIDDAIKANYSKEEIKKMINNTFGVSKFEYKKIIFSGPCTIILWKDGTKTIAKTSGGEAFDPEKGVAICFMKKILGHTETNKILRKASKQHEDYIVENGIHVTLFDDLAAYLKNPFNHIDQSTINEVKKVEEEQDNNLAIGSRCSTCKYYDRPMTADPCSYCISDDQYKKREETKNDN